MVTELAGEGIDTVYASVAYAMGSSTSLGIENLILTGTGNINGVGNELDNAITGNSGHNTAMPATTRSMAAQVTTLTSSAQETALTPSWTATPPPAMLICCRWAPE